MGYLWISYGFEVDMTCDFVFPQGFEILTIGFSTS